MTLDQFSAIAKATTDLVGVLVWPFVVLFVVVRFRASLADFLGSLGELTFKAAGVEATAKRQQVEAAAALGAALASRPADAGSSTASFQDARSVASVVAKAAKPLTTRRLRDTTVLWVDDQPDNNRFERQALESLGVRFVLSTSTDDALQKLSSKACEVIISDMAGLLTRVPGIPCSMPFASEATRGRSLFTPAQMIWSTGLKPSATGRWAARIAQTNYSSWSFQRFLVWSVALGRPNTAWCRRMFQQFVAHGDIAPR